MASDLKEKIIEAINSTKYGNGTSVGKNFQRSFVEKIAENLIASGVTIPVRCKDCEEFYKGRCENVLGLPNPYPGSFCSMGKRRCDDGK